MVYMKSFKSLMVIFLSAFLISIVFLTDFKPLLAQGLLKNMEQKSFVGSVEEMWKIEAVRIIYDHKTKEYEAQGGVKITSRDRSLKANWAKLDTVQNQVELKGNVLLEYGPDWLKGDHALWNLDSETGWVDGGMVYFHRNHTYVQGKRIAKTGADEFELEDGFVTTCEPDRPDWKVRYKKLRVDMDGIAWSKHSSLWIADKIPVLYFPFLAMPANRDRQSGFLSPDFAASELNGIEAEIPFFWAARRDMDATLFGHYLEKRGWMTGLEYRINHNTWGEGIWLAHYLSDQAGKEHLREQGYPFITKDRYWIRARHSLDLPYKVQAQLDLDVASDRNFLKEFETGSVSHGYTDKMFRDFSGRGLINDKTVLTRDSNLYVNRRGEDVLVSMDVHYWDNLDRSLDEFTLQQLPKLNFDVAPSGIGNLPLYYSLDSSYVNYWRREGDRGNRVDLYPKLYYPLHWKSYLNVEPSVGARFTSYWVNWEDSDRDSQQQRIVPDVQLTMNSRLNRVFKRDNGKGSALQHAIRPEINYHYIPDVDQDDLPVFDSADVLPERHDLRYGFSTFLTTKTIEDNPEGRSVTRYHEAARLRVSQAYYIRKGSSYYDVKDMFFGDVSSRYDIEDPFQYDNGSYYELLKNSLNDEGRLSDVRIELDVTPARYVNLSYDTDLSTDDGSATRHDVLLTLDSTRGHVFHLNYRFLEDSVIDELISHINLNVLPNLSFSAYYDYSFDRHEMFKQTYSILYQSGCWGVRLGYNKEAEDQRVSVSLNLLGLGEIAGGL